MSLTPGQLRRLAQTEGLDLAGAAPVGPSPYFDAYQRWLEAGHAAGMGYLARPDAVWRRQDPRHILPDTETVLVVAASYAGPPPPPLASLHGRVARYAWGATRGDPAASGEDYHVWLLARLKSLIARIESELGASLPSRCYVDTGPVLERAWAEAAGLGWAGKNTNLIHPRLGSYLFLGVALLGAPLAEPASAAPAQLPTCGSCSRCIEACPTGAIIAPRVVDARRCLSYLTIEHRGEIPEAYRAAMGTRLFGCDTCQEVCPWNRRALAAHRDEPAPDLATLHLPELLTLDPATFRTRFRHTPLWRATPDGLARNAAIVLGNLRDPAARPALGEAVAHHPSALVREHAAWALART
jgi:epoxyqueuosine reductase